VRSVLQPWSRRQSQDFNDAGVADTALDTECITCDDLELGLILGGKCHEHHEEAHK
jgi:hypothetical protein